MLLPYAQWEKRLCHVKIYCKMGFVVFFLSFFFFFACHTFSNKFFKSVNVHKSYCWQDSVYVAEFLFVSQNLKLVHSVE